MTRDAPPLDSGRSDASGPRLNALRGGWSDRPLPSRLGGTRGAGDLRHDAGASVTAKALGTCL